MQQIINKRSLTVLILSFLFLAGCRTAKYQRPSLELPEQFSSTASADTNSVADIEWKQVFTDTTLQSLIQKGITYNHDLLIAVKRIDIAAEQVKQARVLQLPEVGLQVTGQYSHPSKNSLNGVSANSFLGKSHIENYNTNVAISWEADIWGKIRGKKEAALTTYLQTQEAAKAVQTELVAHIAQGFFNLLMLDKQLDIAHKNMDLRDTFLMATRLLKDAGIVTQLAVQQAESQKQTTALLVPQLEQSIAIQENMLQMLTGQLPGNIHRKAGLSDIHFTTKPVTGMPVAMVARRPDVRTTEMSLMVANTEVGIARANMYPALNITLGGGLESFKASNWFSIPNSLFGLAAGTIAQPIFQHRKLKTEYEVSKLRREQAVIQFRQSVWQATGEVANALVQADKLKEQENIAAQQVGTLTAAVVNARLLFKSDMANYLEVITAQSDILQAELNLALVQRQQLDAFVELYRSLGGGWK